MKLRPLIIARHLQLIVVASLIILFDNFLQLSLCDCLVGPELLNHPLSNVGSYLQIFTSIRFSCSGKVVRWNYYSRSTGTPVYFGVWEAVNSTTFRLVDYNRVVPNTTGLLHEEILDPAEFVSVTPGLYLGIHYDTIDVPQDKQVVPYADAIKPDPYTVIGLADGFPVGVGHNQIVQSNGYITFTGILFKNWRLPALQSSVKFLIDCGKPPAIPWARVTYKTTLAFSTAVYQCNSGYRLIGSPISTCQSSGLWSAPPICDINDLCFAGPDLFDTPLESASSFLQLFPSLTFSCGGFVGRWWFFSRVNSRIVYLSIWRQVAGNNAVKLVGANRILAANRGLNYFRVPEDDMIYVEPGDFVGIFYDRPDLHSSEVVVPFAAEHNLHPYVTNDLTETLLLPMGRLDVSTANGYIDLTKHADGAIAYWRVPAFRGYVITATLNPTSDPDVPVCPQPPLVAYATIAFSSTKVGALAVYSCVQGYTLYGENPIKCLTTQKWSGSPECRLIPRCGDPPVIDNATPYFNSTGVGSSVTYYCKSGYVVNGINPITCLTNLSWTQPLPKCELASACPPPPVLLNGQLTMTGTLQPRGAVAFFSCKSGYVMVGGSSVFCTDDRTWSTLPVCAPAMPTQPPSHKVGGLPGATGPQGWEAITRQTTTTPEWTIRTRRPLEERWPPDEIDRNSWGDWPDEYYTTTKQPCRGPCRTRMTTTETATETPEIPRQDEDYTTSFVSFNVPTDTTTIDYGAGINVFETMPPDTTPPYEATQATPYSDTTVPISGGSSSGDSFGAGGGGIGDSPSPPGRDTSREINGGGSLFGGKSDVVGDGSSYVEPVTSIPLWAFGFTTMHPPQEVAGTSAGESDSGTGVMEAETTVDYGLTATDEGVVLVRTVYSESDDFAPNLLPAVIVPIIVIILIVMFAIVFAWYRYKQSRKREAEGVDYNGQSYYENVKHGIAGTSGPDASIATGYARGSHSSSGYNDQYGAAPGTDSSCTKTDEDASATSDTSSDDFVQQAVADLGNVKTAPNFFMTTSGGPFGPAPTTHHSAGAAIPPPPPPLPPPPAYGNNNINQHNNNLSTISYNNTYYARGRPLGSSTYKRNR